MPSTYANGHISATGDPIHFMFCSRVGFSGTADLMALFPVRTNLIHDDYTMIMAKVSRDIFSRICEFWHMYSVLVNCRNVLTYLLICFLCWIWTVMFATICLFLLQCYFILCEYQKLHTVVICIFRQCFVCNWLHLLLYSCITSLWVLFTAVSCWLKRYLIKLQR